MKYKTDKRIVGSDGTEFVVGDTVTIKHPNGGGCGGCRITRITDTGFHFSQGGNRRDKTVQYKDICEIR